MEKLLRIFLCIQAPTKHIFASNSTNEIKVQTDNNLIRVFQMGTRSLSYTNIRL